MDLEQRVVHLELRARRFRYFLTGAAGLAIVFIVACAWYLHAGASAGAGRERAGNTANDTMAPTMPGDAWAYVAGTQSSTRVRIVSGGDPARNAVKTDSRKYVDVPDMAIPFDREEETAVLIYFSSGKLEAELGATALFQVGYEDRHPVSGLTSFTLFREYALNETYKDYGTDFVWMGTVPGGKKTLKVRWSSPTFLPVTMGIKSGTPRRMVLVEFNDPPEEAGGA